MKTSLTLVCVLSAFVAGAGMALWYRTDTAALVSSNDAEKPLYWVAPMDPGFRRDKPGKSPMGMALVPVYRQPELPGVVEVSPAVVNSLGVATAVAKLTPLDGAIAAVGFVQLDEDQLHHVHIRVDGWIESLNVSAVGDPVEKGQVLFELYSPTLFNAQKDLVSAMRAGERSLVESARQRLRLLGLQPDQIKAVEKSRQAKERIAVFSKHKGFVSALNVRHGMYVEPSIEIMAIGAMDSVWVIAEVFERQAAWLKQDQLVGMEVDSYPGETWQAKVDYIYPVLNPKSRTVQVRIKVANQDLRLKPNMFANLVIHAQSSVELINIPAAALIRGGRGDRVVVALGEGRFRSVNVRAGKEAGGRVAILEGLAAGDRVVTSAQFLIDSESNLDAASQRLDYNPQALPPEAPVSPEGEGDVGQADAHALGASSHD